MKNKQSPFLNSFWIWPQNLHWDLHNGYALFRKEFDLETVSKEATIFITADQSYQLYLNGHYLGRGPARGYQKSWPYDEIPISKWLKKGKNRISIRAYNPGYSNFQYLHQGFAGLLFSLRCGKKEVVSDKSCLSRRQTGLNRNTVPVSVQLFSQEQIDLREEDPAWINGTVDPAFWNSPIAQVPWNSMPWYSLEKRGIPLLKEEIIYPERVLGIQKGRSKTGSTPVRDVSRVLKEEGLTHSVFLNQKKCELNVSATKSGGYTRYLIDFGKTVVGSLALQIEGARGGEVIDTLHAETIDPKSLELQYLPDTNSRMAFSHRMICRMGRNEHFFYHSFGFRYMTLTVRESLKDLTIRLSLRTTLFPMEITGSFLSSDLNLNRIWQACSWTQQVCSIDAFVDTPWREQAQWWGDARVQSWNTTHLTGGTELLRRGIAQIAGQKVPNGLTYGHAPTIAHNCILPDFSLIWMMTLWDYYWQTESLEPLQTHQETVDGILDYFQEQIDSRTGLVQYDSRYWLFLDWTELQREGFPTILNLWLLIALEKFVPLYQKQGDLKRARSTRSMALSLRGALEKLILPNGLMSDGLNAQGKRNRDCSIHAQALAMMAGGFKGLSQKRVLEELLLPFIEERKEFKARPSAYWSTYVFSQLRELGYGEKVVRYIEKHWTPMADYGTTWENYAPEVAQESFSHAWSAHPLFHFIQIIGGIVQTSPAWSSIDFKPQFSTDSGAVKVPTPYGTISSSWTSVREGQGYRLTVPKEIRVTSPLKKIKVTVNKNMKVILFEMTRQKGSSVDVRA